MSYYDYDPNDIALSIQKAIEERAEPEAVSYLLEQRNKKIRENPQLAGYTNDAVTRQAEDYIARYTPARTEELDMLYEARRDMAAENLAMAAKQNAAAYQSGAADVQSAYADTRQDLYSAYQRNALGNEEILASQGLGRGSANAASSGFGETSRMMQTAAYQNNLYNSYQDENAALGTLAGQYMENQNNAYQTYTDTLNELSADYAQNLLEQRNADREYAYKIDQGRLEEQRYNREAQQRETAARYERALEQLKLTGVVENEEQANILGLSVGDTTADYEAMLFSQNMEQMKFDSEQEQRAFENSLAERKFASEQEQEQFERAYNLFKAIGNVQTEEMASVLGVPVGTTYWDYVIAQRNADIDYLDYTVKAQNAATSARNAATSAARAAASSSNAANNANLRYLEYEVAKQKAETDAYEAETERMKLTGEY